MKTIKLCPENIHRGSLVLVNADWPIKEEPREESLVRVGDGNETVLMDPQAAKMLTKLLSVTDSSHQIITVSGFRTSGEQQAIYESALQENGADFTRQYVALPGCSEHQTGLAVDLAENADTIDFLYPIFPYTGVCARFREKAPDYGFIERYPFGREASTHIAHEPWHFRFVGYPHSKIMTQNAMTFEEYTDYLRTFAFDGKRCQFRDNGLTFELGFISPDSLTEVEIPLHMAYQLSGNNADGVVVTLWRLD